MYNLKQHEIVSKIVVIDTYTYIASFHLSSFFLIVYLISRDSVLEMIYVPFSRGTFGQRMWVCILCTRSDFWRNFIVVWQEHKIFLNKLKNLFGTFHIHIYNLFIHHRVIQVKITWTIKCFTDMSADAISKTFQMPKSGINFKSWFAVV